MSPAGGGMTKRHFVVAQARVYGQLFARALVFFTPRISKFSMIDVVQYSGHSRSASIRSDSDLFVSMRGAVEERSSTEINFHHFEFILS